LGSVRQEGSYYGSKTKEERLSYAKWGYIFIAPFFLIFALFQLIPLGSTIYYSFFEYYRSGLKIIGPTFVGLKNYITLFATDLPKYFGNTLLLWIIGFIPQIAISLLLAAWFTDLRLKLKGQTFFKTVIYMPNLIMASAFAMLFFALFSDNGPVNAALVGMGILKGPFSFLNSVWGNRGLIGLMNFLMWFGNTTIMLMAAIMGVDPTLYEAAELDGCTPNQMFWKITIPLIRPILVYVMITSMIGGLQMFDVPQILTNGKGGPDRTSTTMIMYLNNHLFSKNYGMAGAVSVVLFLVCAVLCVIVYMALTKEDDGLSKAERKARRQAAKQVKGGKA
jgi:cellobiose transport system permease protein